MAAHQQSKQDFNFTEEIFKKFKMNEHSFTF